MLKKGIVLGMLSNTTEDGVLVSVLKSFGKYLKKIYINLCIIADLKL